jgi:hypothetical protein
MHMEMQSKQREKKNEICSHSSTMAVYGEIVVETTLFMRERAYMQSLYQKDLELSRTIPVLVRSF